MLVDAVADDDDERIIADYKKRKLKIFACY